MLQEGETRAGPFWSLMLEVSESALRPVDAASLLEETIRGCVAAGLLRGEDEVVSTYQRRLEHGYPVPSLRRPKVRVSAGSSTSRLSTGRR